MRRFIRHISRRRFIRTKSNVIIPPSGGNFYAMAQHVIVEPYNPLWPLLYEREEKLIRRILKDNLVSIHHIGSTSVPGLAAKPIIDIMPVVRALDAVDPLSHEFEEIGYVYMGEFGIPRRRYLRKGGDEGTHQIHIFQVGDDDNILRHLFFRDYLIAHRCVADEYARLKKLALRFPYDIEGYSDCKDSFVKKVERAALEEMLK